jgi:hypothetical protein
MKTNRLLRILSLLGVLLLMAPFYDSCDGGGFRKVRETELNGKTIEIPLYIKVYDVIVDDQSFNAFQIASLSIFALKEATFTDIKNDIVKSVKLKDWYKDIGVVFSFIFNVVILLSVSILILSFTKRHSLFKKVALVNIVLIVLTISYLIFLEKSFVHFSQIKWGYYAFILNSAFMYFYAVKGKPLAS